MAQQSSLPQLYLRQFDYLLLVLVVLTTVLGLIVLNGSTEGVAGLEGYTGRQAVWWGVSVVVFFVALLVPYGWLRVVGWPLYLLSVASLALPLIFRTGFMESVKAGGAASWVKISIGAYSIRLQPSEFAKIITAIVLAHWLAVRRGKLRTLWECVVPVALVAIPMALIFKQPDFGTAAVFLPLVIIALFAAGLDWRIVTAALVVGLALAAAGVCYVTTAENILGLKEYQRERLKVFLEPLVQPFRPPGVEEALYGDSSGEKSAGEEESVSVSKSSGDDWNIRQAEMALGSGRTFGKGWRQGTQSRLKFLPQHYTDFIFSSLGEQFGLVGCLGLLLLYLLIAWRAIAIAVVVADPFGKYLVMGLITVFLTHVYLNVGMAVRCLPVTGLPLPLMSYGGSFLAANYLLFGLVANVGMRGKPAR